MTVIHSSIFIIGNLNCVRKSLRRRTDWLTLKITQKSKLLQVVVGLSDKSIYSRKKKFDFLEAETF